MITKFIDIETGPLPEAELARLMRPFDPAEVKTGNLKDPDKIAAKLAEAEANHRQRFLEDAALDPLTGRVLAIGIYPDFGDVFVVLDDEDEARLLRRFWEHWHWQEGRPVRWIGFNILQFDLPFAIRRSWKLKVPVPATLRRGRYWSDSLVDLRDVWQLGDRQARGSLDVIARHLGVGAKTGEGADFARLWHENRKLAVSYLQNDLELTVKVYDRLFGVGRAA